MYGWKKQCNKIGNLSSFIRQFEEMPHKNLLYVCCDNLFAFHPLVENIKYFE